MSRSDCQNVNTDLRKLNVFLRGIMGSYMELKDYALIR